MERRGGEQMVDKRDSAKEDGTGRGGEEGGERGWM